MSNKNNPFHSASNAQYTRFLRCLQREDLTLSSGTLSDAHLRCAVETIGCLPGYESRCSKLKSVMGYDTPIMNPAPGATTQDSLNKTTITVNGQTLNVNKKGSKKYSGNKYTSQFGNSSTPGRPEMSGYSFMPSTFRDNSRPIVSPEVYGLTGINGSILPGRVVSATHQRVSGDKIIPLSRQLTSITSRQLSNVSNTEEGWAKTFTNLNNLNQTTRVFQAPPKISSGVNINGTSINNLGDSSPWNSVDLETVTFVNDSTGPNPDTSTSTFTPGSYTSTSSPETPLNPDGTVRPELPNHSDRFTPFDSNNIRYTEQPLIDLTPLEIDSNGNYVPAGPTARATISSPTPEVTFKQEDLLGIPENSELYLNGHKIIIRSPDVCDIKSQVNCGVMGVKAETSIACNNEDTSAGNGITNEITLSSCDGSAFTVANGCGGGTYKQVGDFHINRGFDQQKQETYNANALVINRQLSTHVDENGILQQNPFMRVDASGNIVNLNEENPNLGSQYTFTVPTPDLMFGSQPGGRHTTLMDNTSETTTYSTGGSGYRVGDRLRLVGGTPVDNTIAPLTKICIESAGAGFTNPANITVLINSDGQSSGIGASAAVTALDENGGIAEIQMLNYGAGYDVSNPPSIELFDKSPLLTTFTTVNSSWTADINDYSSVTISSGEIVAIENPRILFDAKGENKTTEITRKFYLATAPVTLGTINTVAERNASTGENIDVSYIDPDATDIYTPNRIKLTTQNSDVVTTGVRHNSYAKVTHFPATKIYGSGVTVQNSSLTDFRIHYNSTLWQEMQAATIQKLGSLNGDDVQVAIYTQVGGDLVLQGFAGYGNHISNGSEIILGSYRPVTGSTYTPSDNDVVYIGVSQTVKYLIPSPTETNDVTIDSNSFVLESDLFTDANKVSIMFPAKSDIIVEVSANWWDQIQSEGNSRPKLVETIDPRIKKVQPVLSAKVGINPDPMANNNNIYLDGYDSLSGPLRVAKFIVTGVNSEGTITQLRIIDRGLYKVFPSDLTYGIPLEYDYVTDGFLNIPEIGASNDITTESQRRRILGVVDPSRKNAQYGSLDHSEYLRSVFPSVDELVYKLTQEGITQFSGQEITDAVKAEISRVLDKRSTGQTLTPDESVTFRNFQLLVNEYYDTTGITSFKHPDWEGYKEYYYNGVEFVEYTGSPGSYDPSTYVIVDQTYGTDPNRAYRYGTLLRKDKLIDISLGPLDPEYGKYKGSISTGDTFIAGGTGARVFLTAQDVPNCSEKGNAQEALGLPDEVTELNSPNSITRALNNALTGAGYSPDDITFKVKDYDDIGVIELDSDFPGIKIDSPTPGLLEKLGIPRGDYNMGMLCIEATLSDPTLTSDQANVAIDQLFDTGAFGLLDSNAATTLTGVTRDVKNQTSILSLLCVDRLGATPDNVITTLNDGLNTDPNTVLSNPAQSSGYPLGNYNGPVPLNDNNSIFGDGSSSSVTELFRYDLTDIYGTPLSMGADAKQLTEVCVFESKRFNEFNQIGGKLTLDNLSDNDDTPDINNEPNAWVDNYEGTGWAYLENGIVRKAQSNLTDTKFINDVILYNPETGEKTAQLDFWDPFKGVLPGFIQNEIHHISDKDPVSYTNSRSVFGRNNIGKVWWDTSTVRYQWYEQGDNEERRDNWGKTFPGSSITVCEWVESKSLPSNWNGNGKPRWTDSYVTERYLDPTTGEYELFYYYWVQNRTVVDDRIRSKLGRQLDTQTIAKYIANPVGYGLQMISFTSQNSIMISNASEAMKSEEEHLQVNFSRNLNPDGLKHTAWKLMREGDDTSDVPQHLTDKLIDSLCGYNADLSPVPDPALSEIEKYGVRFRPRQTMFKDVKSARRVMHNVLNEILAGLKLNTQYPDWDEELPELKAFHTPAAWYNIRRTDPVTGRTIRYDSSYKPVYSIDSVKELYKFTGLPDGTVIQVNSNKEGEHSLWIYNAQINDYEQIAITGETMQFVETVYTADTTPLLAMELRSVLTTLNEKVFVNTSLWNIFFFEMLKHAYAEQQQLDWAFKTSYLYVEKEENDLISFTGFKPDNFQKVLDYMNEVKPFNAKIREYKDGKRAPIDYFTPNSLSDFDKPTYVDSETATVRVLDDNNSDDVEIMKSDPMYSDYVSIDDKTQDPFRKIKTTLTFDRTNWQLTEFNWDMSTTSANASIANNIATLNSVESNELLRNTTLRAADRIFKFDDEVQATFAEEVNTFMDDATAASNISIVSNADIIYDIVSSGQLKNTLSMIKTKVGGDFGGEDLNAYEFKTLPSNQDYVSNPLVEYGFDVDLWDENTDNDRIQVTNNGSVSIGKGDVFWDETKQLIRYEGSFNETSTFLRDDVLYEGFDGITFQRVLYGAERPEELALFDPQESLIITVTTTPYANGDEANASLDDNTMIEEGRTVTYRNHRNLFGGVDYVKLSEEHTAEITNDVFTYSTEIVVSSEEFLAVPNSQSPGYIWVGSELIAYGSRKDNILGLLTRGAKGTSIQDHEAGTPVYNAGPDVNFNKLNPASNVWLDIGITYIDEISWDRIVSGNTTVITTDGTVTSQTSNTTATIFLTDISDINVNTGIKITNDQTQQIEYVLVTNVDENNNIITVRDGMNLDLDASNVIVDNADITAEIIQYGDQAAEDYWDALAWDKSSDTIERRSRSLSDRLFADFTVNDSIMRYLHDL